MISFNVWELLPLVGVLLSFITVLVLLMTFYDLKRRAHYDEENRHMVLELMRRSIETQLYTLTDKLVATEGRWRDVNHLLISSQNLQPQAPASSLGPPLTPFLDAAGLTKEDTEVKDDLIFVLTPFHPKHRDDFDAIASVCRDLGLTAQRGDEEYVSGDIFPHILRSIVRARVVVANVDGRNPNVFYELGIAHALGKPTVLISRTPTDVPFDIRTKRLVLYSDPAELRERLRDELARVLARSGRRT